MFILKELNAAVGAVWFRDYGTLGLTGEEEGPGVMPMYNYTRLVPAAAAQSDCSTSSPKFTGLARLLDYISQVRFCTQA